MTPVDPQVLALCRLHHETHPQQLIIRLCRQLLDQHPVASGPSPLLVLGSLRGVRRYHSRPIDPKVGCSGLLIPCDGGYEIAVHSGEPQERQNFSIAHEIVHTFFREAYSSLRPSVQEEALCDLGAAELIMPAARFATYLAEKRLSLFGIDQCRQEYAVSLEAAARRAIELTEVPSCFLIATIAKAIGQSRSEDQQALRIIKWWCSRAWHAEVDYTDRPLSLTCLAGQAFTDQDERRGRTTLGIVDCSQIYEVQARGYAYPLPDNPAYRQVVVLASHVSL